jgi:hypothetical protein
MKKQRVYRKSNVVGVEYPTLGKAVECDLDRLSDPIKFLGLAHGIGQKLGDAASGKEPAEKFEMASRIVEALYNGDWELTGTRDDTIIVVQAVSRIKGVDETKVHAKLEKLEEEKASEMIKEWRSHPKIKAEIAKIRAEQAQIAAENAEEFEI